MIPRRPLPRLVPRRQRLPPKRPKRSTSARHALAHSRLAATWQDTLVSTLVKGITSARSPAARPGVQGRTICSNIIEFICPPNRGVHPIRQPPVRRSLAPLRVLFTTMRLVKAFMLLTRRRILILTRRPTLLRILTMLPPRRTEPTLSTRPRMAPPSTQASLSLSRRPASRLIRCTILTLPP